MSNGTDLLEGFGDDFTVYQDTVSDRIDSSFNKLGGAPVTTPDDTSSVENNWIEDYIRGQIDRKIPLVEKGGFADLVLKLPDYADLAGHKLIGYGDYDKETLKVIDNLAAKAISYGAGAPVDFTNSLLSLLGFEVSNKPFLGSKHISGILDKFKVE